MQIGLGSKAARQKNGAERLAEQRKKAAARNGKKITDR